MTKLLAAFRNFANVPKNEKSFDRKFYPDHVCENLQNVRDRVEGLRVVTKLFLCEFVF